MRASLLALALVACAVFGTAGTAQAHAALRSATPGTGAIVPSPPKQVVLRFSEDVQARRGSIEAFDPDGHRVDSGSPVVAGGVVTQRLAATSPGTYGVSYTIVSADGHVVQGSYGFSVGTRSANGSGGETASQQASQADATTDWVYGIARGVLLLALLIVAGGGIFSAAIAPDWRPRGLPLWLVLLDVAAAVSFVCVSVQADRGKLLEGTSTAALRAGLHTPFGTAMLVLVLAGAACGPAMVSLLRTSTRPSTAARVVATACFVVLAACLSLSGHAHADGFSVRLVLDMLHVVAAAVWVGGLVQLWSMAPEARTRVADIDRFSSVAFASFVLLLLTGAYATWTELGHSSTQLLHSQYGRTVLAKLVLYAGTIPLAILNKTVLVPGLRSRPAGASSMLRQYVARELGLLVVVIALTAWLVQTPHPS